MKFINLATKFVISNRAAPGYKLQYDIPIFITIYCSLYPLYLYVYTNSIKQYDYCILLFSFHLNNNYSTYLFFQEST